MTKTDTVLAAIAALLLFLACLGLAFNAHIHRWERENNYPYGKMCNSVFTLWVDSCRR